MGARHKMARTLLTAAAAAAAALCLACADPTSTTGPNAFNLDNVTGKWLSYLKQGNDATYRNIELEIKRQTPEEIAVYRQSWHPRNNSQGEISQDDTSDSINWQHISFYAKLKFESLSASYEFLIETLTEPSLFRMIYLDGRVELLRIKLKDGKLIFREIGGIDNEFNFYRTLPDLVTYARCENFDILEATDAVDADFLVGEWNTNRNITGLSLTLRVTRKTAEEVFAYRHDLKNTTIGEADIDWTKVPLEVEIFGAGVDDEFRARGLIEFLNKPGSIRVIPLKDTWDSIGTREVDNWFTSQNLHIKKDDEFLAIRNCNNPWQKAYGSRRLQISTRRFQRL